jgi:hypothetical protein
MYKRLAITISSQENAMCMEVMTKIEGWESRKNNSNCIAHSFLNKFI